jgi:hypothetical protein
MELIAYYTTEIYKAIFRKLVVYYLRIPADGGARPPPFYAHKTVDGFEQTQPTLTFPMQQSYTERGGSGDNDSGVYLVTNERVIFCFSILYVFHYFGADM